ncbi:hypothetical protein ACVWZN_000178 [Lysobacter sp. HA35]
MSTFAAAYLASRYGTAEQLAADRGTSIAT